MPGNPKELSLEDADRLREKRVSKSDARDQLTEQRSGKSRDPWANWKNKT